MNNRSILKSKTFWGAIVQFGIAFTAWAMGDIDLWILIIDGVAMLGAIFYRDSIDQNLRNFFNQFDWWKDKATWTAIAAALGFVGAWLAGDMQLSVMLVSVFSAILGIFLRSAQSPESDF